MIGGGDVKFLTAVGGWVGPKLILYSTLWELYFVNRSSYISDN
jgi:Flp pilus assembly protein protease CpaA